MHTLLKKDQKEILKFGLWQIKLFLTNKTVENEEDYSIITKFFILPTHANGTEINSTTLNSVYRYFWKAQGFCLVDSNEKLNGILYDCNDVKSHWSTLYPDPKSSIVGLNYENGNLEQMLNTKMRINFGA